MRAEARVKAIGTAVFLLGFGFALCVGVYAHNMTHEDGVGDRWFSEAQVLTIVGLIIASAGIGIMACGSVFENHEHRAGVIPAFAIVIGSIVSTLGFGTALWAALWIQHMGYLSNVYVSNDALQSWSVVGFWVGALGMVIAIYGLSSSKGSHSVKRLRKRR